MKKILKIFHINLDSKIKEIKCTSGEEKFYFQHFVFSKSFLKLLWFKQEIIHELN